jgi:hypothetical protein
MSTLHPSVPFPPQVQEREGSWTKFHHEGMTERPMSTVRWFFFHAVEGAVGSIGQYVEGEGRREKYAPHHLTLRQEEMNWDGSVKEAEADHWLWGAHPTATPKYFQPLGAHEGRELP